MKELPLGRQVISEIILEDCIYVDKTRFVEQLINGGSKYCFLSRPRRFGKTLLLSTLEEVFKGNKELFKGCDIYDSDYGWTPYPV